MSKENKITYYIAYKDDGPKGICGQAMSITSPWNKLIIFDDYFKMKKFADNIDDFSHRLNPRIEGYWEDSESYYDIIDNREN